MDESETLLRRFFLLTVQTPQGRAIRLSSYHLRLVQAARHAVGIE